MNLFEILSNNIIKELPHSAQIFGKNLPELRQENSGSSVSLYQKDFTDPADWWK